MNVKIKSSGVSCLVGDDYDRVFAALRREFSQDSQFLFTERIPGYEYLQWILPGEGWVALSDGDPIMCGEVRKELLKRQQIVLNRFGSNQAMAQKILSIPSEEYVYYKADTNGGIDIKLTVWGYRYPEKIEGTATTGNIAPKNIVEHITLRFEYDSKPAASIAFRLNGFVRVAEPTGVFVIGNLPVGYQFEVQIDDISKHIVVQQGVREIVIDVTKLTTIEVNVTRDGVAAPNTKVTVVYGERNLDLTTDETGRTTAKIPIELNATSCTVTVENETQQMLLKPLINTFNFDFNTLLILT